MNPDKIQFNIRRVFKPLEQKQYFILEAPGLEDLVIPESRILMLPQPMRRKFYMQQGISFKIIMPALNGWLKDNNEKTKDPQIPGKDVDPSLENTTSGPQS